LEGKKYMQRSRQYASDGSGYDKDGSFKKEGNSGMKLSGFDFEYPRELIAKYPVEPRDQARLMVIDRKDQTIRHRIVADLPEYFNNGDVMVVNNTKVFPARLYGSKEKTGAKVEVFLLRELNDKMHLWDAIVEPARKIRVGNKLYFDEGLTAEVIDNTTSRGRTIRFLFDGSSEKLNQLIDRIGTTPIPPYLKRKEEDDDRGRYQTVFAQERGAVAAPTAGLHFTPQLVENIQGKGVQIVPVTLHVGIGTFRNVEVEDLTKHRMDSELYDVSTETADIVNKALSEPEHRVTVVGTTAVRALESSLNTEHRLKAGRGWTDKFIYPPHEFQITQRLMTNFHMPQSTLFMLVSALAGTEFMRHCYQEAIKNEYRLFSFGDAMLIL
jgi:S-adenosylmethionine:tRNA ribosyltransferase-isomerase